MTYLFETILSGIPIKFPQISYTSIFPEAILIGVAVTLMLAVALIGKREATYGYTGLGVAAALTSGIWSYHLSQNVSSHGAKSVIGGSLAVDGFSTFFMILTSIGLIVTLLVAEAYIYKVASKGPEFVALALLSASGAMLMESAYDLLVLFIGLEILSISLYVMVAYTTSRKLAKESAFKYFILGGFASALFLYGVALTYGATGSTNLAKIALFLSKNTLTSSGVLLAGMVLMLAGLGFKVALVPFQFWTPDVYQGAPTTVTGYMSGVVKAAGFAALLRVFYVAFGTLRADWQPVLLVISILTLSAGAVLAVIQKDVKRMLAYSSINHAGFILLGLYVATVASLGDSLYYLFAYTIMSSGTFAVISMIAHLEGRTEMSLSLDDLKGLGKRYPKVALSLAVLLLAQAGAPFTIGFLAKFSVLSAVIEAHHYALGTVAMLSVVVAAVLYLRITLSMYSATSGIVEEALDATQLERIPDVSLGAVAVELEVEEVVQVKMDSGVPIAAGVAVFLTLAMTIGLALDANPLVHFAAQATLLK